MYEKYVEALRLMDLVIATKDLPRPEEGWPLRERRYRTRDQEVVFSEAHPCHDAWDRCYIFIFANFAKPETAMEKEWKLWQETHPEVKTTRHLLTINAVEIERLVRSMPPELAEQVFPVAIARFLLRESNMPIDHRIIPTFQQFHDWYGPMILSY